MTELEPAAVQSHSSIAQEEKTFIYSWRTKWWGSNCRTCQRKHVVGDHRQTLKMGRLNEKYRRQINIVVVGQTLFGVRWILQQSSSRRSV